MARKRVEIKAQLLNISLSAKRMECLQLIGPTPAKAIYKLIDDFIEAENEEPEPAKPQKGPQKAPGSTIAYAASPIPLPGKIAAPAKPQGPVKLDNGITLYCHRCIRMGYLFCDPCRERNKHH